MEIWGGIECTINRVEDQYFDQLDYQGLYTRKNDLNLILELGVKKLRYPVLWEKHQPSQNEHIDWSFVGAQLTYLNENGVDIIAGLVHHGSGPAYVNILDDSFAEGLAAYALKVAIQFPFINHYTPVNEPLTTARFCGLYGLWYPHKRDDSSFLRILYNECKGTALAMKAIRKVNPNAKLVHTEDIGKTHSTTKLAYQAKFENRRKWIGMDLLCGKVNPKHNLYKYLIKHGITKEELAYFIANPCPPEILGFNYYITSERFLDQNIATYPAHTHGQNNKHIYADIEAVRSSYVELDGPRRLLKEAWQRYRLPIAITEAHLHCGREDQLRWLKYLNRAAHELEEDGVNIRGVTAWSLFGAYGWDQLLTTKERNYESGVFDVRTGEARATALAKMVQSLAKNIEYDHPVMEQSGWWMRPDRILYPNPVSTKLIENKSTTPILIIGASGTLGSAFSKICTDRNLGHVPLNRHQVNFGIIEEIEAAIELYKPWAIINAAGFVRIDAAENQQDDCFLSNTIGPVNLAVCCRRHGIKFLTFSSDQVFDGKKNSEYTEFDDVNPLNLFGLSKAKAEELVLQEYAQSLIIRTSELLSPWAPDGFITNVLSALDEHKSVNVADDIFVSPTLITDLINSSLDLLIDDESKIWHLANQGTISWADLAREVAFRGRYSTSLLVPKPHADLNFNAIRPSYTGLTSDKGIFLPTLENALDRYFKTIQLR